MAHAVGEEIELAVDQRNVSASDGKVVYDKDSHVMRPKYSHYIFDEKQFEQAVQKLASESEEGERPERFTLKVRVLGVSASLHNPSQGAAPSGGIKNTYYTCEIL